MSEQMPPKLAEIVADFASISDRSERTEMLIHYADQFEPVPAEVAVRPYSEENHVTYCESDAYVWALPRQDGTLKLHFAVENPQGLSAMAMAAILQQTVDEMPASQLANLSCDIVYDIFGKDISMGKGQGLMGIVRMVSDMAKRGQPG